MKGGEHKVKHSETEIITALNIIRDECDDVPNCEDCPFGNGDGDCLVTYCPPSEWNINQREDSWKGLF